MSTKIDDLPCPVPITNEVINDLSKIQNELQQDPRQITEQYMHRLNELDENQTNVKMDIRKKVHFKEPLEETQEFNPDDEIESNEKDMSLFEYIKSQINEENLLIFVMLILASRSELDNYTKSLPFIGVYAASSLIASIIKCAVTFIIFFLSKN